MRRRRRLASLWLGLCAGILLCGGPPPAVSQAAGPLRTGLSDGLFTGSESGVWLNRAKGADAELIRVFVRWRDVVGARKPASPRDPADPAYDFSGLDTAVSGAAARGMEPLLTLYEAPNWAEGGHRPKSAPAGSWKPSVAAYADFTRAVSARYSGSFAGLPRVRYFQAWNEPNIDTYLAPQWHAGDPVAVERYLKLMNAASDVVHKVNATNQLVTAGLAPYGEPPGGHRTRPLTFWRDAFCLKGRSKLRRTKKCGTTPHFDILAAHAINTSGPPRQSALNPDDASSGDLEEIERVLGRAEALGTIPGGRHPSWVTEFWWESDPPDRKQGYPPPKQAAFVEETMYLAWKAGFSAAINLQLRDSDVDKSNLLDHNATGLYFFSGKEKPSLRAFRFPFVADRKSKKKVELWGKAPKSGKVVVEQKKGKGWKKVESTKAGSNRIFDTKTKLGGRAKLRAKAGGETSLVWKLK